VKRTSYKKSQDEQDGIRYDEVDGVQWGAE
jgi:hypothetical protein